MCATTVKQAATIEHPSNDRGRNCVHVCVSAYIYSLWCLRVYSGVHDGMDWIRSHFYLAGLG